jgi:hypothetical protein
MGKPCSLHGKQEIRTQYSQRNTCKVTIQKTEKNIEE